MSNKTILEFSDKSPTLLTQNIEQPWVEKYRPASIDELVVDDKIREKLKKIIKNKNMPNIILTGTPGCGKTSAVLCIAKHIIGNTCTDNIIELNASNNRGLDIINNSIIHFCKKKKDKHHKILILDEADNITNKAQHSLSNLMDRYLDNTRFAFTCNDINKIIESIQSRCIIIKFEKPTKEKTKERLKFICSKEKVKYEDKGLEEILNISNNDLRQSINNIELIHYNGIITKESVLNECDIPYTVYMNNILTDIFNNNFNNAINHMDNFINVGYSRCDICLFLIEYIKETKELHIDEEIKILLIDCINKSYININNGHNTNLQLYACVGKMFKLINNEIDLVS